MPAPVQQSPTAPSDKLRQSSPALIQAAVVVVVVVVEVVVVAVPAVQISLTQNRPLIQKPRFSSWLQFSPSFSTFWQNWSPVGSVMRGTHILPEQQLPRDCLVSVW